MSHITLVMPTYVARVATFCYHILDLTLTYVGTWRFLAVVMIACFRAAAAPEMILQLWLLLLGLTVSLNAGESYAFISYFLVVYLLHNIKCKALVAVADASSNSIPSNATVHFCICGIVNMKVGRLCYNT